MIEVCEKDILYMRTALELSLRGEGAVNPNPLVGAVIVKDGRIIGEGFHERCGGPHAEINALNACAESPEGAEIYVSLEPCAHYGRTPPCADALIKSGVKRVVCAIEDPNPLVGGRGIGKLRQAGIEALSGVLSGEAAKINEVYIKYVTQSVPFVVLKSAVTLDGKTVSAGGESKWISSEASRERVHFLRNKYGAVLTGVNTVLADDPLFTARVPKGRNPVKIILDSGLKTPVTAKILSSGAKTLIAAGTEADEKKAGALERAGAEILRFPLQGGRVPLKEVMTELGGRGIDSVMIEAGGNVNAAALSEGIVDKLLIFAAPKLLGGAVAPTFFEGEGIRLMKDAVKLEFMTPQIIGGDILIEAYVKR